MQTVQRMLQGALIFALAAGLPLANVALATPNNWTGGGDGLNWFDDDNWSDGVPDTGHEVTVAAGSILLTNETAELAAFTMTGGTLTFTNWMTRLRATDVSLEGDSILTLPPAFTDIQESNRVWIVCSSLTLGVNAKIDANERGYAVEFGPGREGGEGTTHGGYGFIRGNWDTINHPYGSVSAPTAPGSGGMHATQGGPGGGAIWIDAAGEVTIHGTISADSGLGSGHSSASAGSGGSVYIRCNIFNGSENGLISANGGQSQSTVRPSGGRIAVVYNPEAQGNMNPVNPGVRFDLRRGRDREAWPGTGEPSIFADPGTLYLPDTQFLSATMGTQWNDVRFVIPDIEEWQVDTLQVDGWIAFDPPMRRIRVDGNLEMNANSRLTLYSSPTNEMTSPHGFFLDVGGDLIIHDDAILDLISNPTNGAAPYIECRALYLESDGEILAERRGYDYATGPSWDTIASPNGGGGYGGRGGGTTEDRGQVYGSKYAPVYPGSGGSNQSGGRGGGLVRIAARGAMRVDGTIQADGMLSTIHSASRAGSGGAILLTAGRFSGDGELRAQGGHGRGLGGGGGRIAVWTPFIPFDAMQGIANREHLSPAVDIMDPAVHWPELTLNVDPADGQYGVDETAEAGTIFFGAIRIGTLFKIR